MNNSINKLQKIAKASKAKGLNKTSADLIKISKRVNNIKIAQYVGVQGYLVENIRCWSKCYRNKRAAKPDMSAQEVFQACHDEYISAMNGENDEWRKYAEINRKKLNKTAQKIFDKEQDLFNKKLKMKLEQGLPIGDAVFSVAEERKQEIVASYYKEADKLLKLSEKAKAQNKVKLAEAINGAVSELLKEALFDVGKAGTEFATKVSNTFKNLRNMINNLNVAIKQLKQISDPSQISQKFNQISQYATKLNNSLHSTQTNLMALQKDLGWRNRKVKDNLAPMAMQAIQEIQTKLDPTQISIDTIDAYQNNLEEAYYLSGQLQGNAKSLIQEAYQEQQQEQKQPQQQEQRSRQVQPTEQQAVSPQEQNPQELGAQIAERMKTLINSGNAQEALKVFWHNFNNHAEAWESLVNTLKKAIQNNSIRASKFNLYRVNKLAQVGNPVFTEFLANFNPNQLQNVDQFLEQIAASEQIPTSARESAESLVRQSVPQQADQTQQQDATPERNKNLVEFLNNNLQKPLTDKQETILGRIPELAQQLIQVGNALKQINLAGDKRQVLQQIYNILTNNYYEIARTLGYRDLKAIIKKIESSLEPEEQEQQ